MPTLHELQSTMMDALLGSSTERALAMLAADHIDAGAQLQIYRNTVTANFEESLRSSYPAIARLVGNDYFRQLSRELQRLRPSRSGDLLWAGEHLPAYLAQLHATGEYQYLADVARLEWLCQEALLAADHPPLDLTKLAGAAADHPDSIAFELHPTLRFVESRFPVLRIWQSNLLTSDAEPEAIDLACGADCLVLLRPHLDLEYHRLDSDERRFVLALLEGGPFAVIVENCTQADPHFDATSMLQRFVAIGSIVDCC